MRVLTITVSLSLTQHFKRNPFFTNSVLVKEVSLDSNGECVVRGTDIDWEPGMVSDPQVYAITP